MHNNNSNQPQDNTATPISLNHPNHDLKNVITFDHTEDAALSSYIGKQLMRFHLLLGRLEGTIKHLGFENEVKKLIKDSFNEIQETRTPLAIEDNEDFPEPEEETRKFFGHKNEVRKILLKLEMNTYPDEIRTIVENELDQLDGLQNANTEASNVFRFLNNLLALPWENTPEEEIDLKNALSVLDSNHFGLEKVKDRILDFLAVKAHNKRNMRQPILCLVGPPGVGKTSIGASIAKAMGRELLRLSVGGVDDAHVIKGFQRTYTGSRPGLIMDLMAKATSNNPVILIDEIDKLGSKKFSDPAAALLEVLDPEQNRNFTDHYYEIPFDLSNVFFITTANSYNMSQPLMDRMEIIELPGYTHEEKFHIARGYLIHKQVEDAGLIRDRVKVTDEAIHHIIDSYTAESGVRNLNRAIETLMRKTVRKKVENQPFEKAITPAVVREYLGKPLVNHKTTNGSDEIGVANSLTVGPFGGFVKQIEVLLLPGKGALKFTGKIGDTMQESAEAAISYLKSKHAEFGIPLSLFNQKDVHIHAGDGAIPKDGPSAGITIATALASAFLGIPCKNNLAMTGEINLRGQVLPVGSIEAKILGAQKDGKETVIIPQDNEVDVDDIDEQTKEGINILFVSHMDEVLKASLTYFPESVYLNQTEVIQP